MCLIITILYTQSLLLLSSQAHAAVTQKAMGPGGCPVFPADNIWNRDISALPIHPNSASYINSIGLANHVHTDFGAGLYNGQPIGFPYVVVNNQQPKVPVSFQYASESEPGPYPIPANAPIEGGLQGQGDRHVMVVNSDTCLLYELFSAYPQSDGSWKAGSGAIWNLRSNALRPKNWTSADAAGLPMLPGLVRYDEIASGIISHALRFTVNRTQQAYIWPARHFASNVTDPQVPPMGLRVRLKASFNLTPFPLQDRIILTALQHYGMIVADNGASWFISGAPDERWNNDELSKLWSLQGSNFEAVDTSSLIVNSDSAQSLQTQPIATTPSPTSNATKTASPAQAATKTQRLPVHIALPATSVTPGAAERSSGTAAISAPKGTRTQETKSSSPLIPIAISLVGILLLYGVIVRIRKRRG